ncbi:CBS domain-containing protein [Nocardia sp. NPDC051750]|uniref:CBS domain-containing protein n=1 Tax=Nocardia sp. NPDC051750 TaxID=3364325 RepID=UPI0037A9BAB7
MRHMTVAEVMTADVVGVDMDTSFHDVVQTLARHRINGAPVLDADKHCVGMVTEADLLARQARLGGPIPGTVWSAVWRKMFARKSEAVTAGQLMSAPVVTIMSETSVSAAAATLARHDLHSAPVIDARGHLVGIVSRKDVLGVYLRPDAELAAVIRDSVLRRGLQLPSSAASAEVHDGVVTLKGATQPSMIGLIGALVAAVDGVVGVRNLLIADTASALMHVGVHSLTAQESVAAAARRMRAANIGSLLVLDEAGAVTGIVTDRDLALRCVADGMDAEQTAVGAVASGDVVTVDADRHVGEVVATLREHRLHRVPVVSHDRPVGIVSEADIARRLPRDTCGKLMADLHAPQQTGTTRK